MSHGSAGEEHDDGRLLSMCDQSITGTSKQKRAECLNCLLTRPTGIQDTGNHDWIVQPARLLRAGICCKLLTGSRLVDRVGTGSGPPKLTRELQPFEYCLAKLS
jgi:hypothetical protein